MLRCARQARQARPRPAGSESRHQSQSVAEGFNATRTALSPSSRLPLPAHSCLNTAHASRRSLHHARTIEAKILPTCCAAVVRCCGRGGRKKLNITALLSSPLLRPPPSCVILAFLATQSTLAEGEREREQEQHAWLFPHSRSLLLLPLVP